MSITCDAVMIGTYSYLHMPTTAPAAQPNVSTYNCTCFKDAAAVIAASWFHLSFSFYAHISDSLHRLPKASPKEAYFQQSNIVRSHVADPLPSARTRNGVSPSLTATQPVLLQRKVNNLSP
jgi:hypothetical protein